MTARNTCRNNSLPGSQKSLLITVRVPTSMLPPSERIPLRRRVPPESYLFLMAFKRGNCYPIALREIILEKFLPHGHSPARRSQEPLLERGRYRGVTYPKRPWVLALKHTRIGLRTDVQLVSPGSCEAFVESMGYEDKNGNRRALYLIRARKSLSNSRPCTFGDLMMKAILYSTCFALCFFGTTNALGQSGLAVGALNNQAQMLQMPDHPEHASEHPLAQEQNLYTSANYAVATGERPLWEVAPKTKSTPLGDIARVFRKEHETAKKAVLVWNN